MPVTGCTWRSSPSAQGCWDRGGPPPIGEGRWREPAWPLLAPVRGHPARSGTGLLSRPASNAPARDDTHPAAWNVPVGSESLLNTGAQTLDDAPESARSVAEGPYSLFEARFRRRAGSVARAYGAVGGRQGAFATETWGSCPHTRSDGWAWGALATDPRVGCSRARRGRTATADCIPTRAGPAASPG